MGTFLSDLIFISENTHREIPLMFHKYMPRSCKIVVEIPCYYMHEITVSLFGKWHGWIYLVFIFSEMDIFLNSQNYSYRRTMIYKLNLENICHNNVPQNVGKKRSNWKHVKTNHRPSPLRRVSSVHFPF